MCEFFRSPLHYPLPGWGPSPSTETLDLIIGGTGLSFLLGRKLLPRLALPFLSSSLPRQTKEDEHCPVFEQQNASLLCASTTFQHPPLPPTVYFHPNHCSSFPLVLFCDSVTLSSQSNLVFGSRQSGSANTSSKYFELAPVAPMAGISLANL